MEQQERENLLRGDVYRCMMYQKNLENFIKIMSFYRVKNNKILEIHTFWTELTVSLCECSSIQKSVFTDTEEYIEDLVPINDCYNVDIKCQVEANGI